MEYMQRRRRMLIDIHIPDWEPSFLSKYEPAQIADMYVTANCDAVMFYCKSHVGLCNWPTPVGKMHAGLNGRDVTAEMLAALEARGIASCAYHSLIFDNWAYLNHPDWRTNALGSGSEVGMMGTRYGVCCPNNPGYRDYEREQVTDLLTRYQFDCVFYDMTFWPAVCACEHCTARLKEEDGIDIPTVLDWLDPNWCTFHEARQRWMREFCQTMTDLAHELQPKGTPVYHNYALATSDWRTGYDLSISENMDFCGGDNYGDALGQLMWCKFTHHLTTKRPPEFMTSVVHGTLGDHVSVRSEASMRQRALGDVALDSASLFIDAIDPIGTVNSATYEQVGRVFAEQALYEPYAGGEAIEDVGIYFSSDSKVDFAQNGTKIAPDAVAWAPPPHVDAVRGAMTALQRAHLPFGIVTRKQLRDLKRFKVIVLPNVCRMTAEEVVAFRTYVAGGGRLYASKYTSLVESNGTRRSDFLLADVFGVHLEAEEAAARNVYLKPAEDLLAMIRPQLYVSVQPQAGALAGGVLRLQQHGPADVLGTLTLPYGHPHGGTVDDQHFASIHSSPPWDDTSAPALTTHSFGSGVAVYSAFDIETSDLEASRHLFTAIMRRLIETPSFEAETHDKVWVNAFKQAAHSRLQISFLNSLCELGDSGGVDVHFALRPPKGKRFTSLRAVPGDTPVEFATDADGTLRANVHDVRALTMLLAEYGE